MFTCHTNGVIWFNYLKWLCIYIYTTRHSVLANSIFWPLKVFNPVAETNVVVARHYADVEGLVELRRSEDVGRFVGGAKTSPQQFRLHQSPTINDCFYRNMYRFVRIAVIDFDEVSLLSTGAMSGRQSVISLFGSVFRWDQTAQVWSQSGVEINQSPHRNSL